MAALVVVCAATLASAQESGIAGLVIDATGAVVPGVTVEASSPALIEGVRTAITDAAGRYAIVQLRPGTYTVVFTLPGFSTVRRDGIVLTAQFTASVNAEMKVGALEETIIVSGASPVVDVQNVTRSTIVSSEAINSLPTAKSWSSLGVITVGINSRTIDVGGAAGEQQNHLTAHGSVVTDFVVQLEGMNASNFAQGTYSNSSIQASDASTEELVYELGAISADVPGGGVRINIIPKQGGNRFSGSAFGNGMIEAWQANNFTDEIRAQGVTDTTHLLKVWDTSASLGGPIQKNRMWFYTAHRYWGVDRLLANTYYDTDPLDYVYIRDLTRQADNPEWNFNDDLRLTRQIGQKHKLSAYYVYQDKEQRHWFNGPLTGPEAGWHYRVPLNYHATATWTSTLTSKLLFEGGFSSFGEDWTSISPPDSPVGEHGYSVFDTATGERARTKASQSRNASILRVYKAVGTYVTGSHRLKFGMLLNEGFERVTTWAFGDAQLNTFNTCTQRDVNLVCRAATATPISITVYNTPTVLYDRLNADLGLYVQEQWTLNKLTINAGLRFDYNHQSAPEQDQGAGTWVPARHFAAVDCIPCWKDFQPRLGINYDLFGNGKTAVRATLSRYVAQNAIGFSRQFNPINTTQATATRTWSDPNGDWIPQESELGPLNPATFGSVVVSTRYDPALADGWHVRPKNWEFSAGIAHELLPRLSVDGAYFRRSYGNIQFTDNLALNAVNFDRFCVTAPVDARLPGGGGYPVCGYDANSGATDNYVTNADPDDRKSIYDGVDINVNYRPGKGLFFQGGVNVGRTYQYDCGVRRDNPYVGTPLLIDQNFTGQNDDCAFTPPWQPGWRGAGAYTLPWYAIQVSGTLQSNPGPMVTGRYAVSNGTPGLVQSLGRNLRLGTASLELVEPGTQYYRRRNQLDLRASKYVNLGTNRRLQLMFDLYNVLNDNSPITTQVQAALNPQFTPGGTWPTLNEILPPRFFKLGAQFTF
jgi:hypothetical protein